MTSGRAEKDDTPPPFMKWVVFDLPFVLFLADNFKDQQLEDWVHAVQRGETPPYSLYAPRPNKPSTITLGGGLLPVFLPAADVAPEYSVRLSDLECQIWFLRRVNPDREPVLMGEVPGDRTGRASFSTVKVRFDPRLVPQDALTKDESALLPAQFIALDDGGLAAAGIAGGMGDWVTYALDAVNHFIAHYRVICHRPWAYPVTEAIVQHFSIGTETLDGQVTWQIYMGGTGPMRAFGGSIPQEQDKLLRGKVDQPEPPDVRATLYQDVLSHLELGDFRLAIIETAVLFEAQLTATLETFLKRQGKQPEEIQAVLHWEDGRPHEVEHVAKVILRDVSGFEFNATHEFRDWKEKVARLRNDVVHGIRFDVDEAEAVEALRAVRAAVEAIHEQLFPEEDGGS